MTIRFMEGFEGYSSQTQIRRRHNIPNSGSVAVSAGRIGGSAYHAGSSDQFNCLNFGELTDFVLGFAFRFNATNIAAGDIFQCISGTTGYLTLRVTTGSELILDLGSTQIDKSNIPILGTNWHYIEFKANIDNSTGSYELRLDGINVASDTGVDTQNGTDAFIDRIVFYYQSQGQQRIDDLYILDDAGLTNNDFLGDIEIQTIYPDGDGNVSDFTPLSGLTNWEMVDDGDTPDGDTTYVSSAVLDDTDLYTLDDMVSNFDTVYALQVRNHIRKENAGERQTRTLIRSNTDEQEGASRPVSTEFRYYDDIHELDPQGGGAWTETRINALEAGITIEA